MSQPQPLLKTLSLYGVRVPTGEYQRIKRIADALWPLAYSDVPKARAKKEAVVAAKQVIFEFLERIETI